jgi:biotin-(acetyl-CoA carboxylase) ligase
MAENWAEDHREMPSSLRALNLPPPFRVVTLREAGDAFAYASAHAADLGAGTLVFVGRFNVAEFAVVLEPDEPLTTARRGFYAGMTALADALAALAPAETPIAIEWPDRLKIGRGLVGGGRFGWPCSADEQVRPDWLVFGAVIRLVSTGAVAALDPSSTSLTDEGYEEVGAERLVEGFTRHLMVTFDRWQEGNFAALAESYLRRLLLERGARYAIDASGNLRIERAGESVVSLDLVAALTTPTWLDHRCGHPR